MAGSASAWAPSPHSRPMPTAILRETVWTALRSRIDFSLSQRICRQIWGRIAHPTMYGDMMASRTSFKAENQAFLGWLRRQCDVVEADLAIKHERMRRAPFVFLRATYFRWARRIETVCPELSHAPAVLAAGGVHLEIVGTWRDAEARLVWGINDFDEAAVMPYPFDLVRLVTSAHLAPGLKMPIGEIAACVLRGYKK